MKKIGFFIVLIAGTVFLVVTFLPRVRFADPDLGKLSVVKHCFHDEIYLGRSDNDVLMFGASRTGRAASYDAIGKFYSMVESSPLKMFKFQTAWANPDMDYFILRDYLENNPAPKVVLVELMPVRRKPPPVRYVHPFFSGMAPFDLYFDVLRPNNFKTSYIFNLSDFIRLLLRHIDLSLTNLLVADHYFVVPDENDCPNHLAPRPDNVLRTSAGNQRQQAPDYETLLDAETANLAQKVGTQNVGKVAALIRGYKDKNAIGFDPVRSRQMINRVKRLGETWQSRQLERSLSEDGAAEWDFQYYRRMVRLARNHGVEIVFYILPSLLDPAYPEAKIHELEGRLNANVEILPFPITRVSYHFYRDVTHVSENLQNLYGIWFASLVSERLRD